MGKIHMQTENVLALANELNKAAEDIQHRREALSNEAKKLSRHWDGNRAHKFEGDLKWNLTQIEEMSYKLEELARKVRWEVDQWMEADQMGGRRIKQPPAFKRILHPLDDPSGHTAYYLLQGRQAQYYEAYLRGRITKEELKQFIEEDPFEQKIVDTSLTIYSKDAAAAWAVMDGRAATRYGTFEGSLLRADLSGGYSVGFSDGAFNATVQGEAGAYLAKGNYNTEVLGAAVAATAYLGANVAGSATASFDPLKGNVGVSAGVDAFVGAKAEASVTKEVEIVDGVKASGTVHGAVSYGLGATAEGEVSWKKGHLKVDYELGATVGLGAEVGVSFDVDVQGAAEYAAKSAYQGAMILADTPYVKNFTKNAVEGYEFLEKASKSWFDLYPNYPTSL